MSDFPCRKLFSLFPLSLSSSSSSFSSSSRTIPAPRGGALEFPAGCNTLFHHLFPMSHAGSSFHLFIFFCCAKKKKSEASERAREACECFVLGGEADIWFGWGSFCSGQ